MPIIKVYEITASYFHNMINCKMLIVKYYMYLHFYKLTSLSDYWGNWLNVMDLPSKSLGILEKYIISKIMTKGNITILVPVIFNLNL